MLSESRLQNNGGEVGGADLPVSRGESPFCRARHQECFPNAAPPRETDPSTAPSDWAKIPRPQRRLSSEAQCQLLGYYTLPMKTKTNTTSNTANPSVRTPTPAPVITGGFTIGLFFDICHRQAHGSRGATMEISQTHRVWNTCPPISIRPGGTMENVTIARRPMSMVRGCDPAVLSGRITSAAQTRHWRVWLISEVAPRQA